MSGSSDVLVVGAGPAGATAARVLASGGARVQLIDRARFPRHKPCGGAISVRVLQRFPGLAEALRRIPTHWISRLHLESPAGDSVTLSSPAPAALMIRRAEFDHLLVRLAVEAGAHLTEGAAVTQVRQLTDRVEVTTGAGRIFAAPVVVAADGVNSVVTRRLGLNPGWQPDRVALDMMEEAPHEALEATEPDALWAAYGYRGSHGYAYVFPKRHHVNVGVGFVLDYFQGAAPGAPYEIQRSLVENLTLRGSLRGESCRDRFTPYLIPVGGPITRTVSDRVIVAGDAGGFVNGFSAEGIYYAMVTGDLAGRAALGALAAGAAAPGRLPAAARRALRRYGGDWRAEVGSELADSVVVQRFLFADVRRIDAMIRGARAHPEAADRIVAYAMGRLSYAEARRYLLARFPLLAGKLILTWLRERGRAARSSARPKAASSRGPGGALAGAADHGPVV